MFLKLTFFKKFNQVFIRVSNSLNPDQEWRSVGPETGQNCLLIRLSTGNKSLKLVLFCSSQSVAQPYGQMESQ